MTSPHGIFPDKPWNGVKIELHPVCAMLSTMTSYRKGMSFVSTILSLWIFILVLPIVTRPSLLL